MRNLRRLLLALLSAALLAGACSSTDPDGATGGGSPSGDGLVITDGVGRTVELDGPAQRVVVLEWVYAEALAALGVDPVSAADPMNYRGYVGEPALPDGVVDVGTRATPNLEQIIALDPDLIIGIDFRHATILRDLEAIAPTLLFDPYPADADHLQEMRDTFTTIGGALGRADDAATVLAGLDEAIAEAKATLAGAGRAGAPVVLAQVGLQEGTPGARIFADNAMAMRLLAAIGLTNAWDGAPDEFGFSTVDLEAFTRFSDADFLYVPDLSGDSVRSVFSQSAIWQGLTFVKEGRVHSLGPKMWLYGGPVKARALIETVTKLLVG